MPTCPIFAGPVTINQSTNQSICSLNQSINRFPALREFNQLTQFLNQLANQVMLVLLHYTSEFSGWLLYTIGCKDKICSLDRALCYSHPNHFDGLS